MVDVLLHPAQRRLMTEKMPPVAHHDVILRPLGSTDPQSMIITVEDSNFIPAVMKDLQQDDWRERLAERRALRRRKETGILELNQPVHRRFQLALFELACEAPGYPPVDPEKISGMGLVLRRDKQDAPHGWLKQGKSIVGWKSVEGSELTDPDPIARNKVFADAPEALHLIAADRLTKDTVGEEILPLHIAPPEVCAARKRTILYGIIPVTSAELSDIIEEPVDANDPKNREAFVNNLSGYLKQRAETRMPFEGQNIVIPDPGAPRAVTPGSNPLVASPKGSGDEGKYYSFGIFLQQLVIELGILEDTPEAGDLLAVLSTIQLPLTENESGQVTDSISASIFIQLAYPLLLLQEDNGYNLTMPLRWPAINAEKGEALTAAALACLNRRHADLYQQTAKFEGRDWQYHVRGFVRVQHGDGCPERIEWSGPSETFHIVPWWDSDAPPTKISLPKISDLKNIKPSVAFEMPPELANLLKRDPMDSLAGDGGEPSKLGLGWLCSFSIPIITICAFIILNIMLSLLNIFFHWMMWIKVCLPIPTKE